MAIPILATDVNEPYADALAELGLFKGTGNGYELERPPTRAEAITLLIRVLGKEEEALSGDHEHPFADAGWADAYIGYAYENNIAKGISPTEFGASLMIDHKQYSTLLLRVLGYSDDVGGQFTYEQAYEFAAHKLALKCDADRFTRGELVKLTYAALNAPMHRSNKTLAKKLMSDKVFTQGDLAAAKAKLPREDQKTAVLIYAVASDLESKLGMLSMDINEILDAQSANIEILMQTGGTKNYRNTLLQGGRTQRFRISDDRISDINVLDGADMCNRQTFTDFLTYAKENVIADRYVLVMWDHGEGTLGGFGRDELNENASLSLADMKSAIEAFGKNIDIVVFDACLMGTVECAYALSDTCTYLVASEDITPTEGIYYTTWLNSLSNDMSLSTEELARLIVDSFIVHSPKDREDVMMSVIRLDNISILTDELARTLQRISDNKIAERLAIAELVPYGDNDGYDQYDLLGVFDKIDVDISDLAVALERTLYYKRSAKDGKYSGMALYLPLKRKDDYADVRNVLNEIEYPEGLISVLDTINETNGG
ncbi:MAG: S-layer homology domain-containing protein [Clostridia bacterium]|nr:S-layer homology domain-containing protein [Clostridia bacterium]